MEISKIIEKLPLTIKKYRPVSGGDINQTYLLETEKDKFFMKINHKELYPEMLIKEAHGLEAINQTGFIKTPKVITAGEIDSIQYLLLEWVEKSEPTHKSWENFGYSLAAMHRHPKPYFGFVEDNYIGSLKQINTPCDNWGEFYGSYHLMPFINKLREQNKISMEEEKNGGKLCKELHNIFPKENPSLLHGDLWSGNFLVSSPKEILLIDPAVYYGHREIDLGMTRLFGGFPSRFYEAYDETYPVEPDWEKRLSITQLYPLLVHAILFGGHYVTEVQQILKKYQ